LLLHIVANQQAKVGHESNKGSENCNCRVVLVVVPIKRRLITQGCTK